MWEREREREMERERGRERERERERERQRKRVCQGTFDPRGKDSGERHVSGRFALQGKVPRS